MSAWSILRDRLSALFTPGARDRDFEAEIEYHLELETRRQMAAGHSAGDARQRARARFGDRASIVAATRAERGSSLFEGQMSDLTMAIRSLRRQPGFSALAVVTLALGIGSAAAAFTVFDTVLLRPLPYRDAERLVYIQERVASGASQAVSYPNFADWRSSMRSFDGVASEEYPGPSTIVAGGDPVRAIVGRVSTGFFRILGARIVVGRELTANEQTASGASAVVVTYEFWKSQMQGRLPLGRIDIDGDPTTVVGVLEPGFRFFGSADAFGSDERYHGTIRSARNYRVIARLAPGVSPAAARAEMTMLSRRLLAQYGTETSAVDADVAPLRDYVVRNYRVILDIVLAAAAVVLLVSCTNLVSAQLARGFSREHDVAVRAALGASRGRIAKALFAESLVLVACGAMAGLGVAAALVRLVRVVGVGLLPRLSELTLDWKTVMIVIAIATVTGLVVGIYPALRVSSHSPGTLLRGSRGTGGAVRTSMWRVLVGFEVAVAVVLLIGTTLLTRTLHNILNADVGFDARGVITAAVVPGDSAPERLEPIRERLAALPGVMGAALATQMPLQWGNWSGPVRRPTDPLDRDWPAMAGFRIVSPGYFDVLRQPVLRGRAFTPADRMGGPLVAIITPGIAKALWPGQDPIGKTVATNYLFDKWETVVGVVAEASSWSMERGTQNEIYVPLAQHGDQTHSQLIAMVRGPGDGTALIPAVRETMHDLAHDMPAQVSTLSATIEKSAADRRFAMTALTVFGAVTLLLAGLGIFGVISYTVSARRREIGIRIALGATPSRVQREIISGAAGMATAGIVAGVLAGLAASRYLASELYGVTRFDPLPYVVGAVVLLLTTVVGAYLPALESSRIDPITAIQAE